MPLALRIVGGLLIALGVPVIVSTFARFAVEGRGTPAPIAPTDSLVVGGLYRWVQNPMYVAVGAVIVGQALVFGSFVLLAYLAAFCLAVMTFVRGYEEPVLLETHGAEYEAYRDQVPLWTPRRPTTRGTRGPAAPCNSGRATSSNAVTALAELSPVLPTPRRGSRRSRCRPTRP